MQHQQPNLKTAERARPNHVILAAYLLGTAGGLFSYAFLPFPALIGFVILLVGIGLLLASVTRAKPTP